MSLSLPEPYVGLDAFNELAVREHADQVQRNFERIKGQWFMGQPSGWRTFSYSNSWRSYNGGSDATWGTAGYYKDALGFVHLRGLLDKNGGNFVADEVMFTLPTGFRVVQGCVFSPRCGRSTGGESHARCDLFANGQFQFVSGGPGSPVGFVALEGITFRAEA